MMDNVITEDMLKGEITGKMDPDYKLPDILTPTRVRYAINATLKDGTVKRIELASKHLESLSRGLNLDYKQERDKDGLMTYSFLTALEPPSPLTVRLMAVYDEIQCYAACYGFLPTGVADCVWASDIGYITLDLVEADDKSEGEIDF